MRVMDDEEGESWLSSLIDRADKLILTIGGYEDELGERSERWTVYHIPDRRFFFPRARDGAGPLPIICNPLSVEAHL